MIASQEGMLESKRMKKDSQFTFRIPSDLKVRLEEIALSEGRSVAQICIALLQEGVETYKKRGSPFLQRLLSGQKKNS
jgi:predicted HicB family RNase H-like nuclease